MTAAIDPFRAALHQMRNNLCLLGRWHIPVRWRSATRPLPLDKLPRDKILGPMIDIGTDQVMLSFSDAEDQPMRLILSKLEAAKTALYLARELGVVSVDQLAEMVSQSPRSDGMPSDPVSVPQEGENVCPPAKSSAACEGEK
jgi:hypothetical protein